MAVPEISVASIEYVRVPVSAKVNGAYVNPSTDTVELAFLTDGATPIDTDFTAGTWDVDTSTTPTTYMAQVMVGQGYVELVAGLYQVWVRVTDTPEVPVRPAGLLRVIGVLPVAP